MFSSLLFYLVFSAGAATVPELHPIDALARPNDGSLLLAAKRRPRRPPPRTPKEPTPPPEAAPASAAETSDTAGGAPLGRNTRIEFEGLQIKGQTTKAGEVQILERRDSEMKSMVKRRTSYRDEIIKSVFPVTP